MKQMICDKCHKILVKPLYFKLEQTNHWVNIPNKKFHLCEDCYARFCNFLHSHEDFMDKSIDGTFCDADMRGDGE